MDKFTAKLQLLNVNEWWEELCPSEHVWHFVSKDKRYAATVNWQQRIVTFSRNKDHKDHSPATEWRMAVEPQWGNACTVSGSAGGRPAIGWRSKKSTPSARSPGPPTLYARWPD